MASVPFSPVRMRCTAPTSVIQILPSPIFSVRAAADDGVGDGVDLRVVGEDLDLHLRHEVHGVLGAAVHLGVTGLAPEALHLGDGDAVDAGALERLLHLVELERLDDCSDQLHDAPVGQLRVCRLGVLAQVEARVLGVLVDPQAEDRGRRPWR